MIAKRAITTRRISNWKQLKAFLYISLQASTNSSFYKLILVAITTWSRCLTTQLAIAIIARLVEADEIGLNWISCLELPWSHKKSKKNNYLPQIAAAVNSIKNE